ncbi:MAG TPA: class I SAM-dependent methyltransferase [Chitinispirillaceae bacterium]|nr:class I SAM-dependent methyltransferase [Chitinispirillaceae bacterium]
MSLYQNIYNIALGMKSGTEYLSYGREIITRWCYRKLVQSDNNELKNILDIGCGKGDDLLNIQKIAVKRCNLFGIESYEEYRSICEKKGIKTEGLNIERDTFPFETAFFDIIVINQVLEHTKDIFFVMSEISRILKPNGTLVIGVPNLATWHDRIILLLGQQPSGIKVPGPHVRGFTIPGIKNFVSLDDYFKIVDIKGSGFYPFPSFIAKFLSKLFPSLATSIFFLCERTEKAGTFIEVLNTRFYETNYYRGEQN